MKKMLLLLPLLACFLTLPAQTQQVPLNGCATDHLWQLQQQQDPRAAARLKAIDRQIADMAASGRFARTSGVTTVLTIPVVVHIIHNGGQLSRVVSS